MQGFLKSPIDVKIVLNVDIVKTRPIKTDGKIEIGENVIEDRFSPGFDNCMKAGLKSPGNA